MAMKRNASISERLGRWCGRAWRGYLRQESVLIDWLKGVGIGSQLACWLLWAVKLIVFGALLYVMFWLALVLIIFVVTLRVTWGAGGEEAEEWAIGEQASHKEDVFYDPINHSDTPDSRFDDD